MHCQVCSYPDVIPACNYLFSIVLPFASLTRQLCFYELTSDGELLLYETLGQRI